MQPLKFINVGTEIVTLLHEDAGSSPASYRFLNYTGADILLAPNDSIDMLYDPVDSRWRVGV